MMSVNVLVKYPIVILMFLILCNCATSQNKTTPESQQIEQAQQAEIDRKDDILLALENNKSAFYAVYQIAYQRDNTIQGQVVFEITVLPSGNIDSANIVNSEIDDEAFLYDLVARLMSVKVIERTVGVYTLIYPLNFLPSLN